ncbi:MAG: hypothetical protein CM1200mP10_33050 [Candidatus Neomarinimicrobiota bacterium]|nr:MAG: hypothetical protein CM1200mP10_33050 [Candidatus Neomarinimicrobiota bacterium]
MITDAWTSKRKDIMTSVGQVKNYLDQLNSKPAGNNFSMELINRAYDQFRMVSMKNMADFSRRQSSHRPII